MTERERFLSLIRARKGDRLGFWLGHPHWQALPKYLEAFQAKDRMDLAVRLNDTFCFLSADGFWRADDTAPRFDALAGPQYVFAECEDVSEVDAYALWPDPDNIDLEGLESAIDAASKTGMAVAGGAWSPFFHIVSDLFGMESYFIKMHTDPEVVEAVTDRVVRFYLDVNERVFQKLSGRIDAFFLGNDFGSQQDLLISPECFRRFVLPSFKKLIDQAKRYGLPVILHSCGAIDRVIPDLIDAGVDALHPLQARARGMDAENLAQYKDDLLFIGGVDTQHILPYGTPEQVRDEVRRIYKLWGDGWIVSPSHETLLPNVSADNVKALHDAALSI